MNRTACLRHTASPKNFSVHWIRLIKADSGIISNYHTRLLLIVPVPVFVCQHTGVAVMMRS